MSRPVADEKEELEFLRWIYGHLDFGPAHEDVMDSPEDCARCGAAARMVPGPDPGLDLSFFER